MSKKLEEQLLIELRKRVIEKDRKLQNTLEINNMREATIEALSEMTSLSEREIDIIATEVHNDLLIDARRKKQIVWRAAMSIFTVATIIFSIVFFTFGGWTGWAMIIGITISVAVFKFKKQFLREKTIIIDYFDNKNHQWVENTSIIYNRKFVDANYIFEVRKKNWCYWDKIPLEFPPNFEIELTSLWKKGTTSEYGLILLENKSNYISFQLNSLGSSSYSIEHKGKFAVDKSWKKNSTNTVSKNTQRIIVEDKKFKYYVNNKQVFTGDATSYISEFLEVGVRVCDCQTVNFEKIVVKDDKGKVLFVDDFVKPKIEWSPKTKYEYSKQIEDGKYIFEGFKDEWCFWSSLPINVYGNVDFTLKSVWLSGKIANFGLMIFDNANDYFYFQITAEGKARYTQNKNGEFKTIEEYADCGLEYFEQTPIIQKVKFRNRKFTYSVADKIIYTGQFPNLHITKIAVGVCGKQKIAFEKIIIEEV